MDGDPFVEVLGPVRQIRQTVSDEFARHGLLLVEFVLSPSPDTDGPHMVHILAVPAGNEVPIDDDSDGREAFEEVIRSAREAELNRQHEQARESLLERLGKDDGFL